MIKFLKFQLNILLVGILFTNVANAAVFRCEKPDGKVEYRDTPCEGKFQRQETLTYDQLPVDANSVREEKKIFRNIERYLSAKQKQEQRLKMKAERDSERAFEKEERRKEKCFLIKEKIQDLEYERRLGCKVAHCNRLKRDLAKREAQQRRYCYLE